MGKPIALLGRACQSLLKKVPDVNATRKYSDSDFIIELSRPAACSLFIVLRQFTVYRSTQKCNTLTSYATIFSIVFL